MKTRSPRYSIRIWNEVQHRWIGWYTVRWARFKGIILICLYAFALYISLMSFRLAVLIFFFPAHMVCTGCVWMCGFKSNETRWVSWMKATEQKKGKSEGEYLCNANSTHGFSLWHARFVMFLFDFQSKWNRAHFVIHGNSFLDDRYELDEFSQRIIVTMFRWWTKISKVQSDRFIFRISIFKWAQSDPCMNRTRYRWCWSEWNRFSITLLSWAPLHCGRSACVCMSHEFYAQNWIHSIAQHKNFTIQRTQPKFLAYVYFVYFVWCSICLSFLSPFEFVDTESVCGHWIWIVNLELNFQWIKSFCVCMLCWKMPARKINNCGFDT